MKKRNYRIQSTIVFAFSLLLFCVIAVVLLTSYRFTIYGTQSTSEDYVSQLIAQVNGEIDRYIDYMGDAADYVSKNTEVLEWIHKSDETSVAKQMVMEDSVQNEISKISFVRKDIRNVAIFTEPNRVVFDVRSKQLNPYADYKSTDWYQNASQGDQNTYITTSYVQNIINGRFDWVVTMSRSINNRYGAQLGTIMVDLNYNVINNLCKSVDMGNRGYIYVLDKQGNIIYHPKQQLINAHIKTEYVSEALGTNSKAVVESEEGTKFYISDYSEKTGWTVVGVAYQEEIFKNQSSVLGFYIITFIIFFVIAVFLSALISKAITTPFSRLISGMEYVEKGGLDANISIDGPEEVARLSLAFNKMTNRLNILLKQRERDQSFRRKSEIKALQAQINPHFLYNTLDSIIWMAEDNDSEAVVEMTVALSRLLRSSVSESREMVPLSVEIENINSYLTIQQIRYKEKLGFSINIPKEMMNYMVPKLILQPIVENAIYHGIKLRSNGGEINLSATIENHCFLIIVEDNGVGISKEKAKKILNSSSKNNKYGIGVKNVNERIKLIYGHGYGLEIHSQEGEGTIVKILLPAKEGNNERL